MEKYYITTAIAYTSRIPHIGNTYEAILADSIARFKRMQGYDVYFLTGTDEHGQKIQDQAISEGITPQEHVDKIAGEIKRIWDRMNVSYDQFIRTTENYHKEQVQKIFNKLYEKGDIYKSSYEGMYCIPCESFFTNSQLVDGKCPDCGSSVNHSTEEAYFFKLSNYADKLLKYIEENEGFIYPESRKNEMINNFLKPGLTDLCVSRSTFDWGVKVDFDPKHVVYVWIDALSNYITALGYDVDGNNSEKFNKYWPADLHLIGKDIVRFHTIYWPIILLALDVELPKKVFGHPWLLQGKDKMSKSKGNVMYADDLVDLYGVDATRYYVLREMSYNNDGSITNEMMLNRINADLANTLGNLVTRTISMVNKYTNSVVMESVIFEPIDDELINLAKALKERFINKMEELKISDAIEEAFVLLRRSNKYIDETMPWVLGKDETKKDRLSTVLYNLLESIRISAILLKPFIPTTSKEILEMLGNPNDELDSIGDFNGIKIGSTVSKSKVIFARIEEDKLKTVEEVKTIVEEKVEKVFEPIKEQITIDDFAKLDLRVAKIISAIKHPKADKLLVLEVSLGFETRTVVSGIANFYKPDELVGRKVVLVANLKPVVLRGIESKGMILAASEVGSLEIIDLQKIEEGSRVS
jgi:methionyl-tRNA synthetase